MSETGGAENLDMVIILAIGMKGNGSSKDQYIDIS